MGRRKNHNHHVKQDATMGNEPIFAGDRAIVGDRSHSNGQQCGSPEFESLGGSPGSSGCHSRSVGYLARTLAFVFSQSDQQHCSSGSDNGVRGRKDRDLDKSAVGEPRPPSKNETISSTKVLSKPPQDIKLSSQGSQTTRGMACQHSRQTGSDGRDSNAVSDNDRSHPDHSIHQATKERDGYECNSDGGRCFQESLVAWSTHHSKVRGRDETTYLFMATIQALIEQVGLEWNDFWYARVASQWGGIFRIAYAILTLLNWGMTMLDFDLFFHQWLPFEIARPMVNESRTCVLDYIPEHYHLLCGWIWMGQLVLLALGVAPRFHAICNVVWTCGFHFRTWLLWSGSDIVFRLMAFYLLFLPLHNYTIYDWFAKTRQTKQEDKDPSPTEEQEEPPYDDKDTWPIWPFRLIQIQMCLIYLSTVLSKAQGSKWRDGTAMFYVVQTDDLYGKFFNPSLMFGYENPLYIVTYATLVLELLLPLAIWWAPQPPTSPASSSPLTATRPPFLLYVAIVFHIGIDLSMNLAFFHYIMIYGWCSFLAQPLPCPPEEAYCSVDEDSDDDDDEETSSLSPRAADAFSLHDG